MNDRSNIKFPYRLPFSCEKGEFLSMTVKERLKYLDRGMAKLDELRDLSPEDRKKMRKERGDIVGNREPHHLIYTQSLTKEKLFYFCRLAEAIRNIRKTREGSLFLKGLLPHKSATGIFSQPSTRTRQKLSRGAQILGMDVEMVNLADSSEGKGESWRDTIDTLMVGSDVIYIRHAGKFRLEEAVWASNQTIKRVPIINAGSGPKDGPNTYQHPTQTMQDVYTIWRSFERFGGIEGKTFAFCGDLNARVVRSLIYVSRHFPPKKIYLICPAGRELSQDMIDFLNRDDIKIPYEYCNSLGDVINVVDMLYMVRIQDEYDKLVVHSDEAILARAMTDPLEAQNMLYDNEIARISHRNKKAFPIADEYKLLWEYEPTMKKSIRVLHALPKRDEIASEYDDVYDPFNRFIHKKYQMQNGIWISSAYYAYLFKADSEIFAYYNKQFG